MRRVFLLCLGLAALPAFADSPMTEQEFDAWSSGQTLDYTIDGTEWGSERHFANRRTQDTDPEGACVEGLWFAQGEAICFAYDGNPGPHCWYFFRRDGMVLAQRVGETDGPRIEVTLSPTPLVCPGPDIGT